MEGKGREQKLLNKGIHGVTQTKGREHICEQGQKQEPVHTEPWLWRPPTLKDGQGHIPNLKPGGHSETFRKPAPRGGRMYSSGAGQDSVNQPAAIA